MLVEIKGTFVKALGISARLSLQFQALVLHVRPNAQACLNGRSGNGGVLMWLYITLLLGGGGVLINNGDK